MLTPEEPSSFEVCTTPLLMLITASCPSEKVLKWQEGLQSPAKPGAVVLTTLTPLDHWARNRTSLV